MCGGSTKVEAPKPTEGEEKLWEEQAQILADQRQYQETVLPLQLREMGYNLVDDGQGGYTVEPIEGYQSLQEQQLELAQQAADLNQQVLNNQISQQEAQQIYMDKQLELATQSQEALLAQLNAPPTELEQRLEQLGLLQADRAERALRGELPVAEATTQAYEQDKQRLEEQMSRKLGTGWQETTPGIQALNELEQRWQVAMDAERRGEISSGMGTFLNSLGMSEGIGSNNFNQALSTSGYNTSGLLNMQSPYSGSFNNISQGYQSLMGGYSQAMQPYQFYNNLGLQTNIANAQGNSSAQAGLFGGLGNLGGSLMSNWGFWK